jgi:hypothetical protein
MTVHAAKDRIVLVTLLILFLYLTNTNSAQNTKAAAKYPAHLPYSFSNFVWWSDGELRALLLKRIPGLGDEIATTKRSPNTVLRLLKSNC